MFAAAFLLSRNSDNVFAMSVKMERAQRERDDENILYEDCTARREGWAFYRTDEQSAAEAARGGSVALRKSLILRKPRFARFSVRDAWWSVHISCGGKTSKVFYRNRASKGYQSHTKLIFYAKLIFFETKKKKMGFLSLRVSFLRDFSRWRIFFSNSRHTCTPHILLKGPL